MRKKSIYGILCLLAVLLLGACNENQFDYSELEEINANGQWNLPIGTIGVSLDQVLEQLAENEMVSYDADGNLQITYHYVMDTVVIGKDFMSYKDMDFDVDWVVDNPHPEGLPEPTEEVIHLDQTVTLESDALRLVSAKIRSGKFSFLMRSSLDKIHRIIVKSPNVFDADGSPFERDVELDGVTEVDMAGVYLDAEELNTLTFFYDIYYEAYQYTEPVFPFEGRLSVENLCIQEMSGYVDRYGTSFRIDSAFKLPLDNINGEIQFTEARITLSERNSFNVEGLLRLDTAMLHGGSNPPAHLFSEYPVVLDIGYTPEYRPFFDEVLNIGVDTDYDSLQVSGAVVFNPNGGDHLISLYDTATIGLRADGVLPLKFTIPGVTYSDTIGLSVSDIDAPEMIKQIRLYIDFVSELPFNITAQLFTIDPETERISDSLFADYQEIQGSFNGSPVKTEKTVMVTHQLLSHLMQSQKVYLRMGVDTGDQDVQLNLDDKLKVTLKADVLYDGDITEFGL